MLDQSASSVHIQTQTGLPQVVGIIASIGIIAKVTSFLVTLYIATLLFCTQLRSVGNLGALAISPHALATEQISYFWDHSFTSPPAKGLGTECYAHTYIPYSCGTWPPPISAHTLHTYCNGLPYASQLYSSTYVHTLQQWFTYLTSVVHAYIFWWYIAASHFSLHCSVLMLLYLYSLSAFMRDSSNFLMDLFRFCISFLSLDHFITFSCTHRS